MAKRDIEVSELKARIAELETRPEAGGLDWLKNSNSFKLAEEMTSPQARRNGVIAVSIGFGLFLLYFLAAILHDHF